MNSAIAWLQQPTAQRVGWSLLHFLWQGAALAALFALLSTVLRGRSAQARYLTGCLTLLLMVAAPVATFVSLQPKPLTGLVSGAWVSASAAGSGGESGLGQEPAPSAAQGLVVGVGRLAEGAEAILPWLVAAWLAGVLLLSLRLGLSWLAVRRMRRQQTEPIEQVWKERLVELQDRLGIERPVQLLKSALVQLPTVVGWFRPVILLPASSLTGLSPAQLELVLAHELAHICRYDAWVNLFQLLVETLLFYHPAVWWVSQGIREEREPCCDDLAVAVCGDRLAYAHALATLEGLRHLPAPLALGAGGGSLLKRIRRLLGLPNEAAPGSWRRPLGTALVGLGLTMMAAAAVYLVASPKKFQATTRIQINQDAPDVAGITERSPNVPSFDPYWVQTEVETIQSKAVLGKVIEHLQLNEAWRKKYKETGLPSWATNVLILKSMLDVRQSRNTSLIEIRVVSEKPGEAALLANDIAKDYGETRRMKRKEITERGIAVLQNQLLDQDIMVREKQAEVNKLRDQLKVADNGGQSEGTASSLDREAARRIETERLMAQSELAQAGALLKGLKKLGAAEQRRALLTVQQDPVLPALLQNLSAAQQRLAEALVTYDEAHAEVKRIKALIPVIQQQIEEQARGILDGLEVRAEAAKSRLQELDAKLAEVQAQELRRAIESRPYFQAKRDLETMQFLRDKLRASILTQEIDVKVPKSMIVNVLDPAEPALRPLSPKPAVALGFFLPGALSSLGGLVLLVRSRAVCAAVQPA